MTVSELAWKLMEISLSNASAKVRVARDGVYATARSIDVSEEGFVYITDEDEEK